MNAFYKSFLRDGLGWFGSGGGPRVHLAAFGKHPGWNDHMDDLGLETETLLAAKRILYLEGIARNLATGAWEQLGDGARLPGFNHLFRWQRGGQFLLGRIWSSRDGKGRAHFPMILCAHVLGPPAPPAGHIENVLRNLHQQCTGTDQAGTVRAALAQGLEELRAAAAPEKIDAPPPAPMELGALSDLAHFHRGEFRPRTDPAAEVARISVAPEAPAQGLETWLAALRAQLDDDAPVLLLTPLSPGKDWIDVIAGEPAPDDFFCLRAASQPQETP